MRQDVQLKWASEALIYRTIFCFADWFNLIEKKMTSLFNRQKVLNIWLEIFIFNAKLSPWGSKGVILDYSELLLV